MSAISTWTRWLDCEFLSPIVVKELRQALRARTFPIFLLGAHLAMGYYLAALLLGFAFDQHGFWVILALYLLVAHPLAGFGLLTPEMTENRLDLLLLGGLSGRSLIRGKWLSLNLQSCLILSSLGPYFLLRYYTGADLSQDVRLLFLLWLLSLFLSLITVSLSGRVGRSVRLVLVILMVFSGFGLLGFLIDGLSMLDLEFPTWFRLVALLLLGLGGLTYLLQELVAEDLRPGEQNHQTPLRLVLLAWLGLLPWIPGLLPDPEWGLPLTIFQGMAATAVLQVCLLGRHPGLPGQIAAFTRRGSWATWLGSRFLYPGQATALLFLWLAAGAYLPGLLHFSDDWGFAILAQGVVLAGLLQPLWLLEVLRRRWSWLGRHLPRGLLLIHAVLFFGGIMLAVALGRTASPAAWAAALTAIPDLFLAFLIAHEQDWLDSTLAFHLGLALHGWAALTTALLLWLNRPLFTRYAQLEQEARRPQVSATP